MQQSLFDNKDFLAAFEQLLIWRRDVRHFKRDDVPPQLIDHLLELAALAPSVGLSQPWRFVKVETFEKRQAIIADYEACKAKAASHYEGKRATLYHDLKLAGLKEAPVHLAVFCDCGTHSGHGLGQSTMPQTLHDSVVCAIHTLWLAARSYGLGMGWVSIVQPDIIKQILEVPHQWDLVAYLNLGWPLHDDDRPELERKGWQARHASGAMVFTR